MPVVLAHMQFSGIDDFWNGAAHPFLTPAHAILVMALGLYLGQRAARNVAASAAAFAGFCALGLVWASARSLPAVGPTVPLTLAMLLAILVAIDRPTPRLVAITAYAAGGFVIGIDSGVEHATLSTVVQVALGTSLSVCVAVFNLAFYTAGFTRQWQRVGVRVAASWILAISMLVLAFAIRQ